MRTLLISLLILCSTSWAEVKIEGPQKAEGSQVIQLQISGASLENLTAGEIILDCIPTPDLCLGVYDWARGPSIIFQNRKPGGFSVIVSSVVDGHQLLKHPIQVGSGPEPPDPDPPIPPDPDPPEPPDPEPEPTGWAAWAKKSVKLVPGETERVKEAHALAKNLQEVSSSGIACVGGKCWTASDTKSFRQIVKQSNIQALVDLYSSLEKGRARASVWNRTFDEALAKEIRKTGDPDSFSIDAYKSIYLGLAAGLRAVK